ncbi:hypothetical protein D3C86_1250180 [compost metagenome]
MVWPVKLISSVLPSGVLRATYCAAILPPAPGRLSTTTVRWSESPIDRAISRASASVVPPAGLPTTMVMGLSCAMASGEAVIATAATAATAQ